MIHFLHKSESYLIKFLKVICSILFCLIIIDVFSSVLSRYVLFYPLNFADQLAKYLVIWLAFLGTSLAINEGSNIAIDLLVRKLSTQSKNILLIVIDIMVSIFLFVIIYYGFLFAWQAKNFNDPLVFGMSMIYPYLSVPIGFLFILVIVNIRTILIVLANKENDS